MVRIAPIMIPNTASFKEILDFCKHVGMEPKSTFVMFDTDQVILDRVDIDLEGGKLYFPHIWDMYKSPFYDENEICTTEVVELLFDFFDENTIQSAMNLFLSENEKKVYFPNKPNDPDTYKIKLLRYINEGLCYEGEKDQLGVEVKLSPKIAFINKLTNILIEMYKQNTKTYDITFSRKFVSNKIKSCAETYPYTMQMSLAQTTLKSDYAVKELGIKYSAPFRANDKFHQGIFYLIMMNLRENIDKNNKIKHIVLVDDDINNVRNLSPTVKLDSIINVISNNIQEYINLLPQEYVSHYTTDIIKDDDYTINTIIDTARELFDEEIKFISIVPTEYMYNLVYDMDKFITFYPIYYEKYENYGNIKNAMFPIQYIFGDIFLQWRKKYLKLKKELRANYVMSKKSAYVKYNSCLLKKIVLIYKLWESPIIRERIIANRKKRSYKKIVDSLANYKYVNSKMNNIKIKVKGG